VTGDGIDGVNHVSEGELFGGHGELAARQRRIECCPHRVPGVSSTVVASKRSAPLPK